MANNFNCNKDGPSIEVNIYRDTGLSQMAVEENFYRLHGHTFFYTANGMIAVPEPRDMLCISSDIGPLRASVKAIGGVAGADKMSFEELSEIVFNRVDVTFMDIANLELCGVIRLKDNLIRMPLRGYSQGDYVAVIVDTELYLKEVGTPFVETKMRDYFRKVFFDTEISGSVKIEDQEYFVCDYIKDIYNWDSTEFLEHFIRVEEPNSAVIAELEKLLPKQLDYI